MPLKKCYFLGNYDEHGEDNNHYDKHSLWNCRTGELTSIKKQTGAELGQN